MSLAVAEAVVEDEVWTSEGLAERFVGAFKRDPRKGYASGFYDFLCQVQDGTDFLERIRADSDKSGSAMRATPVGLRERGGGAQARGASGEADAQYAGRNRR